MTINERIKIIRENEKLTQTTFGEKIGLKKSAVSQMEKGTSVNPRVIQLICTNFNVSEQWLVDGTGEMYTSTEDGVIQQLVKEYSLTPEQEIFARQWLQLPADAKDAVVDYVLQVANAIHASRGTHQLQSPGFIPGPAHKNGGQPIATPSAQPFPHPSEVMGVSHSDTSARPASFPGSDHVAESKASYQAPAGSSARPSGISDDEWQLLQAARREKAQTSGTSGSIDSEENRA